MVILSFPGESGDWSLEALRIVEELTRGQMLLAQVYDYAADGVPLIYLYSSVNSQVIIDISVASILFFPS